MMDVKAVCRVCNKLVPANQFRLHHDYRQMVCPACYSGKSKQQEEENLVKKQEAVKKAEPPRPPGWDAEDEYLEKMARIKRQENQAQFTKIPGTNTVKAQCSACKYTFKYDPFKKKPYTCPYCNEEIPRLKNFNLL